MQHFFQIEGCLRVVVPIASASETINPIIYPEILIPFDQIRCFLYRYTFNLNMFYLHHSIHLSIHDPRKSTR
jgi:hypothetical protein